MAGWSAWSGRGAPARLPMLVAILAVVLSIAMCGAPARSAPLPCGAPPPAGEGWEVAAPASVGLDPALLCTIGARLENPDRPNVHALLVIRHGRLVYEAYASGRDERWGEDIGLVDHDAGRLHDLRSVTKSVVSLLFGIARDRGMFGRLDAPILDFFPAETGNAAPEARAVTLRDLLTMTPGFTWNEGGPWWSPANDERLMYEAADPYAYVLSRPMGAPPGTRWEYSGGATTLLGGALERASGERLEDFARKALFEPLGIDTFEWVAMSNGDAAAASGLRLTARDMAKIGQLVLDGGVWKGRRVVSEDWITESTAPRFEGWRPLRYGYQWWVGASPHAGGEVSWIAAIGLGGQRIFIVPALDLVVVSTAGLYRDPDQGAFSRDVLEKVVLPAVREGGERPSAPR